MIYDIKGLRKTIELIMELKSKSAYIFRLFSINFIEDSEFWKDLAEREYERVKVVARILEMVELHPEKFYYNLSFDNATIQVLINDIERKTELIIDGLMTSYEGLIFSKTIMNTIIEKEYYHIVESNDSDVSTIIAEIVYNAQSHYEKFSERIEKHIKASNTCEIND